MSLSRLCLSTDWPPNHLGHVCVCVHCWLQARWLHCANKSLSTRMGISRLNFRSGALAALINQLHVCQLSGSFGFSRPWLQGQQILVQSAWHKELDLGLPTKWAPSGGCRQLLAIALRKWGHQPVAWQLRTCADLIALLAVQPGGADLSGLIVAGLGGMPNSGRDA